LASILPTVSFPTRRSSDLTTVVIVAAITVSFTNAVTCPAALLALRGWRFVAFRSRLVVVAVDHELKHARHVLVLLIGFLLIRIRSEETRLNSSHQIISYAV